MVLGGSLRDLNLVILPLMLAGAGIIASIIATFFVRTKEGGDPQKALNYGTLGASLLTLIVAYPLVMALAPAEYGGGYTLQVSTSPLSPVS